MKPTMYLRVQERLMIQRVDNLPGDDIQGFMTKTVPVQIIQQFWEHFDGKEAAGDIFNLTMGSWRDLPVVRA